MSTEVTKTPEHLHVEKLVREKFPLSPIYQYVLGGVQIVSASRGYVVARLPLSEMHMNSKSSIHGSVSATLVDWMGGMAIATHDFRDSTGVSLDIHITYQSGAKTEAEVEVEGIAERVGGSVAFTRVVVYAVEGGQRGKIIVSASHTKYVRVADKTKSA